MSERDKSITPAKALAAAQAGVAAASELSLPEDAPELGLRNEVQMHVTRLERVIAVEADAHLELRRSVDRLLKTVKVIVPAMIVFIAVFAAASIAAFGRLDDITEENRGLGLSNTQAQLVAAKRARNVIQEACESQNNDRRKLRAIIARGELTLAKLVQEGTITQAQADRSVRSSRQARRELRPDDCSARAQRIPIPKVKVP